MSHSIYEWIGFNVFVLLMLALDLGVFHRKAHSVKFKEALIWSGVWITISLLFAVLINNVYGSVKAVEFLTAYVVEKSLSIDNIFVFVLIFSAFQVPDKYQHKVLFWGVLGALVMRAIFIFAGVTLIERFHWLIYVFGAFLVYTGIKIAVEKGTKIDIENSSILKWTRKFLPVTPTMHDGKFFVKIEGKKFATPLFLVLVMVEFSDLIFAVDSIPAILAISKDFFIVYTSNVFAILGLRSLYFALAGSMKYFKYLHYGLALILSFVGLKMLASEYIKIEPMISLAIIGFFLLMSMLASWIFKDKEEIKA